MSRGRRIALVCAILLPVGLLVAGLLGEPRPGDSAVVDAPALVVTDPAPRPTPSSDTSPTPSAPPTSGPVAPPAPPAVPLDDDDDDDDGPDTPDDDG